MTFADPGDLSTGDVFPEAWADQVRTNDLALTTWSSWTPTITQSSSVTKTVTSAKYIHAGTYVLYELFLAVTGAGSAGNVITVSLPVNAATSSELPCGQGALLDASVQTYPCLAFLASASTLKMFRTDATATNFLGADPSFALASGDSIRLTGFYESV